MYSIKRLWMRSSKRSQVLEPSPLGVFRVMILSFLVYGGGQMSALSFCLRIAKVGVYLQEAGRDP